MMMTFLVPSTTSSDRAITVKVCDMSDDEKVKVAVVKLRSGVDKREHINK